MLEDLYSKIDTAFKTLKLNYTSRALAQLALAKNLNEEQILAISIMLDDLVEKRHIVAVDTLVKLSRLPVKNPKTFANYDFSLVHGKNPEVLQNLSALSEVYADTNIALIGPAGVGKTHLAQAYGRACCEAGMKTYFIKASELNEKFSNARKYDREDGCKNSLVKPTCLIIDEMGKARFDQYNTEMLFDVIDRRYEKEGPQTTIVTSNIQPSEWTQYFTGDDNLLCALDRLFDKAEIINIKGNSYRGRKCQTFSAEVGTQNFTN